MKGQQKKAGKAAGAAMPPLSSESAAELQAQVAQVAAALETGADPDSLRNLVNAKPDDATWDLHLMAKLAALARPDIPPLLAALFGATPDKARRKALKRAIHQLKTRGVPVPDVLLPREESGDLRPTAHPVGRAHLSPVFRDGGRYLILEGLKEALGGNFVVVRFDDEEGIREWHPLSLNRRKQQELWEHFRQQGLGEWATPLPAYAVSLLEEAYARAGVDQAAAGRYRTVRERIWRQWGSPQEAPALEQLLPALNSGEQHRWLEQSRQLAQHPLFAPWLPALEEVPPWLEKLEEVQRSPLVLSEQQRQTRLQQVLEEATAALYPAEDRPLWRRRLLEMAYFLDLLGQGPEARAAQAAAEDLAGAGRGLLQGENPFLLELVKLALSLAREFREEGTEQTPGLVEPSPSLIIGR